MNYVTTIIIGAGQAGLAMSENLADRSIDHVLIERGQVANSWKTQRWDSLSLLTPNWQSRLPGYSYEGNDPNGYMNMSQVGQYLDQYARITNAPVFQNTTVKSVRRSHDGYTVETDQGNWACSSVVIASGACNRPSIPRFAEALPKSIAQVSPLEYKSRDQLSTSGVLVVGASATGIQLAKEIQLSGRQVTLAVGEHIRVPRSYRGHDIQWWMNAMGLFDIAYSKVEDLARARKLSSLQLAGSNEDTLLDINMLSNLGVTIAGSLAGVRDELVQFSGSLANVCSLADLKMNRLLQTVDSWVDESGFSAQCDEPHRFGDTVLPQNSKLKLNLKNDNLKTVIWATDRKSVV